jgi:hypothetical protein
LTLARFRKVDDNEPSSGRFLFADQYTRYEVVEPLIENKTLVFKGIESHQGEKMLRYVLS